MTEIASVPSASRRANRFGADAWRQHRRRGMLQPRGDPSARRAMTPQGGFIWVLSGNLCPQGAIMKPSAASPGLLRHRGKALVFETIEDMRARIDDPDLRVDRKFDPGAQGRWAERLSRHARSRQYAAAAETSEARLKDMVRISDARMSGTAYGTVILHVAPESGMADRWQLLKPATRFCSTGRRASSNCSCRQPRSKPGSQPGRPTDPKPNTPVAITSSISTMCSRPTVAATSTSSWAAAAARWSGNRINGEADIHRGGLGHQRSAPHIVRRRTAMHWPKRPAPVSTR